MDYTTHEDSHEKELSKTTANFLIYIIRLLLLLHHTWQCVQNVVLTWNKMADKEADVKAADLTNHDSSEKDNSGKIRLD